MISYTPPNIIVTFYRSSDGHSLRLRQRPSSEKRGFVGYVSPSPSLRPTGTTSVREPRYANNVRALVQVMYESLYGFAIFEKYIRTEPAPWVSTHSVFPIGTCATKPPQVALRIQLAPLDIPLAPYGLPSLVNI